MPRATPCGTRSTVLGAAGHAHDACHTDWRGVTRRSDEARHPAPAVSNQRGASGPAFMSGVMSLSVTSHSVRVARQWSESRRAAEVTAPDR